MPDHAESPPTPAELEILAVLWERGPATVREVHDAVQPTRGVGYTTVLKLMQIMADKGSLNRDVSRRTHVYRAAVRQKTTRRRLAKGLIEKAFGGSAAALAAEALASQRPTGDEIAELRQLLDDYDASAADTKGND